ncbi:MAG: HD domain-containing protein [Defluviicoccus sp.]|nr:HD domain-containing protein [Defluviicoccus sp.]
MEENIRGTNRVRDPVHGLIVFGDNDDTARDETDRFAWELLNTREFQRLRRIRQLGFCDLVFPGATHSRFAHSVGVYHMARRLARVIARREGAAHDPARERVALLAALLHDVGHGPFSHTFESATKELGHPKRHELWSAEIVQEDTQVNRVLRDVDEDLPQQIGKLLTGEDPTDIYSAIVSSQFDADRLDYIQRDRLMTGVEFGHIDLDWLFDCLEVGKVTIGQRDPFEAPCLYLGPKGVQVAEEYLEARFRLYRMVYMHKTARAAEKMLEALLSAVTSDAEAGDLVRREPVLRYLKSENPDLASYLTLDDTVMWAALSSWIDAGVSGRVSELATRLRDRSLYKCVDIGVREKQRGNLFRRLRRALNDSPFEWREEVLFDDTTVAPYKWYDFEDDASALNKVLVKTLGEDSEPMDIASASGVMEALQPESRIQRAYVPEPEQARELEEFLKEIGE